MTMAEDRAGEQSRAGVFVSAVGEGCRVTKVLMMRIRGSLVCCGVVGWRWRGSDGRGGCGRGGVRVVEFEARFWPSHLKAFPNVTEQKPDRDFRMFTEHKLLLSCVFRSEAGRGSFSIVSTRAAGGGRAEHSLVNSAAMCPASERS